MTCRNENHWVDMLTFGICPRCQRTLSSGPDERKSDETDDEGLSFEPSRASLDYEASREDYQTSSFQEN
jgi:hypothetical protein